MSIDRRITRAALLAALLSLGAAGAHAAMIEGVTGTISRSGTLAQAAMPMNLLALGLDLSTPDTVSARPSMRLPIGTSRDEPADDVIGAN